MSEFRVPVGGEDFDEIRQKGSYYVDKSGFVYDLVNNTGNKVSLFTRPRRFGKTLNMSMIGSFFDVTRDSRSVFEGLAVAEHEDFCREHMNKYPVLSISFKGIEGLSFEAAIGEMRTTLSNVCHRLPSLDESDRTSKEDNVLFSRLKAREATLEELKSSLFTLSRMLEAHFGQNVILLIDEYDVPLAMANENGYYREMLDMMRAVFQYAVKTNPYLQFAVITGCLRIAKESIFTGTNNFKSYSVLDDKFSQYFGFTDSEVLKLLQTAGLERKADEIKSWYDGYIFGDTAVYCPWDVVNYVADAVNDPKAKPKNYWNNTSHNGILNALAERVDISDIHDKFEALMNGDTIEQTITDDLTYDMLRGTADESDCDRLWSVLVMTGYLTKTNCDEVGDRVELTIPNREIEQLFRKVVIERFRKGLDQTKQRAMMKALWNGDEEKASELISDFLWQTVSYNNYHEDYYHAFLAGIFAGMGYSVISDRERGLGRPDIEVLDRNNRRALIIEAKKADSEAAMSHECDDALRQVAEKRYEEDESFYGYRTILRYGVAFYKKSALVKKAGE